MKEKRGGRGEGEGRGGEAGLRNGWGGWVGRGWGGEDGGEEGDLGIQDLRG